MATTATSEPPRRPAEARGRDLRPGKAMTIGAVCKGLAQEFPDISISKIRYLEDQKLLRRAARPAATGSTRQATSRGCGRSCACSATSSSRCASSARSSPPAASRTTAPSCRAPADRAAHPRPARLGARRRRRRVLARGRARGHARRRPSSSQELEDYGVIEGQRAAGRRFYDETEREIIRAAAELARYGVGGRNLRVFRTSADREAALLQQILAPALRSRNPERRKEALEALENLAAVASHLKHLLLVRDLRSVAR